MKVSVIIVSFNHENSIKKAILSALSQSIQDFEILIGDDASKDNTQEVIKELQKEYPTLRTYLRKKNLGTSNNIISLIKESKGDYIAYLEGDDYWCDNDKLKKQAEFLDNHKDYYTIMHSSYVRNLQEEDVMDLYTFKEDKDYTVEDFCNNKTYGHASSFLMRRECADFLANNFNYFSKFKIAPLDLIFPIIFFKHGKIHIMKDFMSVYHHYYLPNGTNWTSTYGEKKHRFIHTYKRFLEVEKISKFIGLPVDFTNRKIPLLINLLSYKNKIINHIECLYLLLIDNKRPIVLKELLKQRSLVNSR